MDGLCLVCVVFCCWCMCRVHAETCGCLLLWLRRGEGRSAIGHVVTGDLAKLRLQFIKMCFKCSLTSGGCQYVVFYHYYFFFIKSYIRDPLIIRVSFSSCSVSTFFSLRKTGENIDVFSLQCVSAAVCIWCYAGGSCGFGAAACSRPRKVSGVWKRATCQLNCSGSTNAWKEQPRKPLHSRGARERDGPLGPPGNVTVINALNLP